MSDKQISFRVTKDFRRNNIDDTTRLKIPRYNGFGRGPGLVTGESGRVAEIILNRITKEFCYHDGEKWQCIDGTTGKTSNLTDVCSPGGDATIVANGVGPELLVKGFIEGPGIDLTQDAECITISAPGAVTTTLSDLCSPDGTSLIIDGVGPNLVIKGLAAGTGIEFDTITDPDCVIINNVDGGSSVTLTDLCSPDGESLIIDGDGPNLVIKGLDTAPGSGLTFFDNNGCLVLTTSGGSGVVTSIIDNCSPDGESLIIDGEGPEIILRGIEAGTGITLDNITNPDCLIISSSGAGGSHIYDFPFIGGNNTPNVSVTTASFGEYAIFIYRGSTLDPVTTCKIVAEPKTTGTTEFDIRVIDYTNGGAILFSKFVSITSRSIITLDIASPDKIPTGEAIISVEAKGYTGGGLKTPLLNSFIMY